MEYKNTENWILNRLPFYQNNGSDAYNPGLSKINKFIKELSLSKNELKFIHVGGTNGKGSTCSFISSILKESNYKVGTFTSPHFFDFRERIRINDNKIQKSYITSFIKENKILIEDLGLSFFELSFGLCLSYFVENKVDYAIIEVGLGGRLDATNIINPLVSVITNISFDHNEILGDSLEKIALEKAGIIKENSKLIVGERNEKTDQVFINKAKEMSSKIIFVPDISQDIVYSEIDYLNKNIHTSIETCKLLNLENLNNEIIKRGIKNITLNNNLFGLSNLLPCGHMGIGVNLFEPLEDSPSILKDKVNPIPSIYSLALLLSRFGLQEEAGAIQMAVNSAGERGLYTTLDSLPKDINCDQLGDYLAAAIIDSEDIGVVNDENIDLGKSTII